jgi:predicted Zn-dependent protease
VRGCLFALALTLASAVAAAAPYIPGDDATVIEHLPADARGEALRRVVELRQATPATDPTVAVTLARRYIERSRAQADPRLLGYAEGLLAPWLKAPAVPTEVLLLGATLHQARHQFDVALGDLDGVFARQPDHPQAWLTRATILRVQGRYPEAAQACVRLQQIAPGFAADLCGLAVRGLSGELADALVAMAPLQAAATRQAPAVQSWFDAELADMLERAGRRDEAEARYVSALGRDPTEPGLLAAYADFLLDANRPADAVRLTAPLLRIDALRLRNAIARRRLGEEPKEDIAALASGFEAAHRRGEDLHLREEARFTLEILHDAPSALDLAQRNWKVQHEAWDLRLLLASAAAARTPAAAQGGRDWLATSKLQDQRLDLLRGATP